MTVGPSSHSIAEDTIEDRTKHQITTTKLKQKIHEEPV